MPGPEGGVENLGLAERLPGSEGGVENLGLAERLPGPEGGVGLGFQHLPRDLANVNVFENNV